MYIVVKEETISTLMRWDGGVSENTKIIIDRIVNSLEEVKSGEIFFKCNVKE